jgi:hypothetical protein
MAHHPKKIMIEIIETIGLLVILAGLLLCGLNFYQMYTHDKD